MARGAAVSALRMVTEVIGKEIETNLGKLGTTEDIYGRWHEGHPIKKLEQVGAIVLRPRKIESVYKVVYMSNEQSIVVDGRTTRINDILAYPLFIAE